MNILGETADLLSEGWTLTLTPRDVALSAHLKAFVIDGAGNEPHCFTLRQANGDASVMLLGPRAAMKLPQPPTVATLTTLCRTP